MGVSLRHVAAEAGVSMGMVQHHFRTKQAMLDYAMDRVLDDAYARVAEELSETSTPRDRVRALLIQMLPLDEQRSNELRIVTCRTAYMVVRPELLAVVRTDSQRFRVSMAETIRAAPGVAPGTDPDQQAIALIASVSGLAMHVLAGGCSRDIALAVFENLLDQVFGPA